MGVLVAAAMVVVAGVIKLTSVPMESPRTPRLYPQADRLCKIVTFYEQFADAIRVLKIFECIVQNLSGNLPIRATSWSFSLLGRPALTSIILNDVDQAAVIVVAMNGDRELPERIATWIEICVYGIPTVKPVLVALHEELEMGGTALPLCSSLQGIANRVDATFMCNRDLAKNTNRKFSAEPVRGRQESSGFDLEEARYSTTGSHRWSGIND